MYIRTKDGVYEIEEIKPYFLDENQKLFINNELRIAINENQVINQSEKIEELCDCIIETKGHTGDYFHYTYTAFDEPSKERLLDDMINQDFEVYYAIWTSKGLIYVAKMDSDGKFVLI